jgi:hypothetical protein
VGRIAEALGLGGKILSPRTDKTAIMLDDRGPLLERFNVWN